MTYSRSSGEGSVLGGLAFLIGVFAVIALVVWWFWGYPSYRVWEQGKTGEAELARAEQNRQIKIAQAHADLEAAKLYVQAEVERAKGVAEANKIMVGTLGGYA